MGDFYARRIIEALRSGISSREVGEYFSSARPKILRELRDALEHLTDERHSGGRIISGKYGEGKTHLLNTAAGIASQQNIVVSRITLSKETPLSSLHVLYPKVVQGTYLPGYVQPGIDLLFERFTYGGPVASSLLEFCLTGMDTNRLYYILKSYLGTRDDEEKYTLLGDISGNFMTNTAVRQIYRRIYNQPATFDTSFVASKHVMDYFSFLERLFIAMGYNGWALLFDETELIGRLSKKARLSAYSNIALLSKAQRLESTYSLFVFNASYGPDVIEAKHEHANLEEADLTPEIKAEIESTLSGIISAAQLAPLNKDEILEVLAGIQRYHGLAYDWHPSLDLEPLLTFAEKSGYLLRTRIRAVVETLDQLYQYSETDEIRINELGQPTFEEDEREESSLAPFI
ncbi:MAG: ATP-binding protein [Synergistaceae bacterium]|jgi:hypothetical protein|nr:ATP-binding protein [Synergistaceae bacterium]